MTAAALGPLTLCLAGCALSFGLRCPGLSRVERLCIGMALSPLVVAAQLVALDLLGASFARACSVTVAASLAAVLTVVVWRVRRPLPVDPEPLHLLPALVTAGVLAACAAVLWTAWQDPPGFALFSWHSMHHADLCYAVTRPGVVPENPIMAGHDMKYPFFAHYFFAAVAWLADAPPNVVYRPLNAFWLMLTGMLIYQAARALGAHGSAALLAVALVLAGNNVVGLLFDRYGPPPPEWQPYLGDPRYVSFSQKYFSFNVMPLALALTASSVLLCAKLLQRVRERSWDILLASTLLGVGVIYPILLPAAGAVVAAAIATLLLARVGRRYGGGRLLDIAGWAAAALLLSAALWLWVVGRREAPDVQAVRFDVVRMGLIAMGVALGPYLLLASPAIARGLRRRDPAMLFPLLLTLGSVLLYLGLPLSAGNGYKWVFVAAFGPALVLALAVDHAAAFSPAVVMGLAVAVAGFVCHVNSVRLTAMAARQALVLPFLGIEADGFRLVVQEPASEREWTRVVREHTPPDTILVTPPTLLPLYALTDRAEYVARHPGGSRGRAGYGFATRVFVSSVYGLSETDYRARLAAIANLYANRLDAPQHRPIDALRSLGRPVVIRIASPDDPLLRSLTARRIGRPLLVNRDGALWLIPVGEETPSRAAEPSSAGQLPDAAARRRLTRSRSAPYWERGGDSDAGAL